MSEGANVTSGIAMRDPVFPPEKPQKQKGLGEFEKEISAAVAQAGKKKVETLLEDVGARLSIGDHVKIDGKNGRVVATAGIASDKPGVSVKQNHVMIKFDDNTEKAYDPNVARIEVVKKNPGYSMTAQMHFDDAKVAKRLVQRGRYYDSLSKGYEWLAKQHEWDGDHETANAHRQTSAEHAVASKKAFDYAAAGGPDFINKYEMQSRERQARSDLVSRQKMAAAASRLPAYQHYFFVPFADKDKAKAAGYKWDATEKKWYQPSPMRYHAKGGPWKFSHTYDNTYSKRHND